MSTETLSTRYSINGLLASEDTVLSNLEKLCNAAGTWLTYDIHAGKWSVIINKSGTSQYSFNDSNIIGPIKISGTGLDSLYNKVTVSYPHEDLKDQRDSLSIEIPDAERNPNEPDNTLELSYDIVTNPVQAELLGFIELKQSRVDKIISFKTDYSKIDIKAGDLIDITNPIYNFTAKMFRVITVSEVDDSDGGIAIEITALEYDAEVYNEDNLSRYTRSDSTGIRSIGSILAPSQPTTTTFSNIARPRIDITTTLNSGLSDTVEFWITYDVPPGVTLDENRTYTLLGTVKPTNSTVFAALDNVTLSVDSLSTSNFLIKCRAKNASATSPFSAPSGQIYYAPVQTTDSIGPDTEVRDSTGGLATTAGLLALLQLADSFFGGNAAVGPGGGSGSGSTFLFLEIQNFNSNATTGGSYSGAGSAFVPVVRIIPPPSYRTRLTENLDQTYLNQCMVGRGQQSGGIVLDNDYLINQHYFWPQYYKHRILGYFPLSDTTENVAGGSTTLYGVDLNSFRYYYPDATECRVEVRGYWRLQDQVQPSVTNSSTTYTFVNSDFQPSTTGTANIRVKATVYTGANVAPGSAFATYGTRGIGVSANVVVTDSIYPEAVGANVAISSKGQHITTFVYNLTKPAYQAPSFDNFGFSNPVMPNTVSVPTEWSMTFDDDVVGNVQPTANVTVNSIFRRRGDNQIITGTTPQGGGTYLHTGFKYTGIGGNIPPPTITTVPFTANAQYVAYEDPPSYYHPELLPTVYDLDESYLDNANANLKITEDMFRVQNTSAVYVQGSDYNLNAVDTPNAFIPARWAQLRANVSASHGISSTEYLPSTTTGAVGNGPIDGVNQNITTTQVGYFTTNSNLGSNTVNHLSLTNTTNANANVASSLGVWIQTIA
jgi:hypothetical protein